MKKHFLLFLVALVAMSVQLPAKDAVKESAYFAPESLSVRSLLPNPPAPESAETEQEMEFVLQKQATRTETDVARIKSEVSYSVFTYTDVVGPWFSPANARLSVTTLLFQRVAATAQPIVVAAKANWQRPRPFLQNARIFPAIERPKDGSYPSGHSTRATLDALILAELVPERSQAIFARGAQVGDDRVLAGVHFPSDVKAGRILAQALFSKLMSDPQFRNELKAAKAEMSAELKKP